jgi:hypothetical protein
VSNPFAGAGPFPPEILKVWNYDLNFDSANDYDFEYLDGDDDDDDDNDDDSTPNVEFQDQHSNVYRLTCNRLEPVLEMIQAATRDEMGNQKAPQPTSAQAIGDGVELPTIPLSSRIAFRGEQTLYALAGLPTAKSFQVAVIGKDGWHIKRAPGPMFLPTPDCWLYKYEDWTPCIPIDYSDLIQQVLPHANDLGLRTKIFGLFTAPFKRFCRETCRSRITLIQQENEDGQLPVTTVAECVKAVIDPENSHRQALSQFALLLSDRPEELARKSIVHIDARHPGSMSSLERNWKKIEATVNSLDDSVATRIYIDWDNRRLPSDEMLNSAQLVKLRARENLALRRQGVSDWARDHMASLLPQVFHAVVRE